LHLFPFFFFLALWEGCGSSGIFSFCPLKRFVKWGTSSTSISFPPPAATVFPPRRIVNGHARQGKERHRGDVACLSFFPLPRHGNYFLLFFCVGVALFLLPTQKGFLSFFPLPIMVRENRGIQYQSGAIRPLRWFLPFPPPPLRCCC